MNTFERLRQAVIIAGPDAERELCGDGITGLSPHEKYRAMQAAYRALTPDERATICACHGIEYGPAERAADERFETLVRSVIARGASEIRNVLLRAGMAGYEAGFAHDLESGLYIAQSYLSDDDVSTLLAIYGPTEPPEPPETPRRNDVDTSEILVVRHDRNGSSAPLVDVVTLPAEYVDLDCTGSAAMDYLASVVRDYAFDDREPTWNDLFTNIPESFLRDRHVHITPVQAFATLEVGMDQEVTES